MNFKMREEDRKAVDLLLDRVPTAAGKPHGTSIYASADGRLRERVAHVEKMLGVLDNMSVIDPPKDLVDRTLRYVMQATGDKLSRGRHRQAGDYNNQPLA